MSEVLSTNVLTCRGDAFGGVTINTNESLKFDFHQKEPTVEEAKRKLENSLSHWKDAKVNGVWFEVDIKHSFWVPLLVDHGFTFHHAQPDRVVLIKWLPTDRESTLPKYPFTNLGVGGVVETSDGRILLMKEQRGNYLGWKFPGGLSNAGENIPKAVIREVLEETGVETEFCGVLTFRHITASVYPNTGDLYYICHLRPKDESKIEVTPCPNEAAAAQWMSRDEIKQLPSNEIHAFHHKILDCLDKKKASGRKGCYLEEFDPKRAGLKAWDMYYID